MTQQENLIHIIGINASGVEGLSSSLTQKILKTERIAAPKRIIQLIPIWWAKNSNLPIPELISSDKPSELITRLKSKPKQTTLLASGDPLWFGIGRLLLENFPHNQLHFHPSPTSFQLAFARLGRPWQDVSWVSIHGRDPLPLAKLLQKQPSAIAVLTDPEKGPQEVKQILKSSGLENSYTFWIFEQLGHPNERIQEVPINKEVPNNLHSLNIVVLIKRETKQTSQLPLFGINDGLYFQYLDRPGLMTKREVRIQLLADLELPSEGVIWDICAGVGSIGLEALRLRPNLKLFSLDKRVGSKKLIESNAKLLSVKPFYISETEALETLLNKKFPPELVPPDRVLLGGGGKNRKSILKKIIELMKLNGIVIIPISTFQAVNEIESILKESNFDLTLSQNQSYRGIPLGEGTRLSPMNPVFILKGRKKEK